MVCPKCKQEHPRFINGKTKKTCPKPINSGLEGGGIFQDIGNTIGNIGTGIYKIATKGLSHSLSVRPKNINTFLNKYGHLRITGVSICREPIKGIFSTLLNTLGLGQWKRAMLRYSYDEVFHLWMVLKLSNGKEVYLEKNERVKMVYNKKKSNNSKKKPECINRTPKKVITVRQLIEDGEIRLGKNFYRYSANQYNCQNFVSNLSSVMGIHDVDKFVLQNTQELLPQYLKTISQGITDIASVGKFIYHGGKRPKN